MDTTEERGEADTMSTVDVANTQSTLCEIVLRISRRTAFLTTAHLSDQDGTEKQQRQGQGARKGRCSKSQRRLVV